MTLLLLLFALLGPASAQEFVQYRSVWVEQGLLKGRVWKFGNHSAQKTMRKSDWRGERLAMEDGAPCIQFMPFHLQDFYSKENMKKQSEDCLYLNIFAPWTPDEGRRYPVLVWVHGGSFLAGSADTTIDREATIRNLVFKGIVVVAVNYRLGPLGFMVHQRADGSGWAGNYGLWDLVMVLKWLNKNARQFGGDAEAITMMGESAGGAAVSALALSPKTTGLMHGAIIMSGSAAAGWAVYRGSEEPSWTVENVAKYLRCEKRFDQEELGEVLRDFKLDAEPEGVCNLFQDKFECAEAENDEDLLNCMRTQLNFTNLPFKKALTVELGHTKMVVDGEVIPESIEVMLRNYSKIPILTGAAADEWAHKKAGFYQIKAYEEWNQTQVKEKFTSVVLEKWKLSQERILPNTTYDLVGNISFRRYIEDQSPNTTLDTVALVKKLHEVEADLEFHAPLMRETSGYASAEDTSAKVWVYSFDHVPDTPLIEDDVRKLDFFGTRKEIRYTRDVHFKEAFHGLDHAYIFTNGIGVNFQFNYTKRERRMCNLLTTLFTNFVKYRDPTPRGVKGLVWPAYTEEDPSYLRIRLPPVVEKGVQPHWESVGFWNGFVPYLSEFATVDDLSATPLGERGFWNGFVPYLSEFATVDDLSASESLRIRLPPVVEKGVQPHLESVGFWNGFVPYLSEFATVDDLFASESLRIRLPPVVEKGVQPHLESVGFWNGFVPYLSEFATVDDLSASESLRIRLPPVVEKGVQPHLESVGFWNGFVPYLSEFATVDDLSASESLRICLPPVVEKGVQPHWESVGFWNGFVPYLSEFATVDDLSASESLRIRLPPVVEKGVQPHWESVGFWNGFVPYLSEFATVDDLSASESLRICLPPVVEKGVQPHWESVGFWNGFVPYLSEFATVDDLSASRYSPLTDRERVELGAYKRAWWALWLLVAAIALLLWTLVICLVAKKCLSPAPDKPINHLILTSHR